MNTRRPQAAEAVRSTILKAILVHSIGTSGASLVKALKQISPLSERKIAALLFQAPAKLFTDLPPAAAGEIHRLLTEAGLDCAMIDTHQEVALGDDEHEVALVIKDVGRMTEIAQAIMHLIGADPRTVRQMLFTTPTVLLGKISLQTALAIRERFAGLDVEVDISHSPSALFDVFLGPCTAMQVQQVRAVFAELNVQIDFNDAPHGNTLLSAGLSREATEHIWAQLRRAALPVRIVNRDFERFDLELRELPAGPDAEAYLVATTGMPAQVAPRVLGQLPMVLTHNISFEELERAMASISELGGKATGHLLAFQTFGLQLEAVTGRPPTLDLLLTLGSLSTTEATSLLDGDKYLPGPYTSLQARWLQYELKKIGTTAKRVLR